MPRYDTMDCRTDISELDPCLAAEIRLKSTSKEYNWNIIIGGVVILLMFLIGVVVACVLSMSSKDVLEEPSMSKFIIYPWTTAPTQVASTNLLHTTTRQNPRVQKMTTASRLFLPTNKTPDASNRIDVPTTIKMLPSFTSSSMADKTVQPTEQSPLHTTMITPAPEAASTADKQTTLSLSTVLSTIPSRSYEKPKQASVALSVYRQSKLRPDRVEQIDTHGNFFKTCNDYFNNNYTRSGVYRLFRSGHYDFFAQCFMDPEVDEAWMVIQKRSSDRLTFWNRTFGEYAEGFGDPRQDSWLGLQKVRYLIDAGCKLKLRMEIEGDRCAPQQHDVYYIGTWTFEIDTESNGYRLHVSRLLGGNFTEPLYNIANNNGLEFNVIRESDRSLSCSGRTHMGGWWSPLNGCSFMALNGEYSCSRPNSMYGLYVYHRRPNRVGNTGNLTTSYIRPRRTRMMVSVCNEDPDCQA